VTALRPKDQLRKQQCVGLPLAATQIRILDADGQERLPGEVGELYSTSNYMFSGYLNMPDAMAKSMRGEWFSAGDLGRLDEDGNLYVVDRLKDVVIRGGENIYAAEVEAALYEHPLITEAAIIGVPHDRLGEEVGAVVRVRDGAIITEDDIREQVATRLAAFKVPAYVWLVHEELPRNASGKVLKRELRDQLAATRRIDEQPTQPAAN